MGSPMDTIKMLIPATIYAIQNNLLFIALSNLNATSYPLLVEKW
jgi:UDP-sugar transporter A1/2/3